MTGRIRDEMIWEGKIDDNDIRKLIQLRQLFWNKSQDPFDYEGGDES